MGELVGIEATAASGGGNCGDDGGDDDIAKGQMFVRSRSGCNACKFRKKEVETSLVQLNYSLLVIWSG